MSSAAALAGPSTARPLARTSGALSAGSGDVPALGAVRCPRVASSAVAPGRWGRRTGRRACRRSRLAASDRFGNFFGPGLLTHILKWCVRRSGLSRQPHVGKSSKASSCEAHHRADPEGHHTNTTAFTSDGPVPWCPNATPLRWSAGEMECCDGESTPDRTWLPADPQRRRGEATCRYGDLCDRHQIRG